MQKKARKTVARVDFNLAMKQALHAFQQKRRRVVEKQNKDVDELSGNRGPGQSKTG